MEWVSLLVDILGIAGFLLSLVNSLYFFVTQKKKLIFSIEKSVIRPFFNADNLLIIKFRIENLSQLPISVTRVQLLVGESWLDMESLQQQVAHIRRRQEDETTYEASLQTESTPVNLDSLTAHSGFFGFVIPADSPQVDCKRLTFRICTNRGRAVQKTCILHEDLLIR